MSNRALTTTNQPSAAQNPTILENPLYSYYANRIILQQFPNEPICRKACRSALKIFAIGASYTAQLPYVGICKTFAKNNSVYAGFLSYGDVGSFGTLLAWVYLSMIDDALLPKTPEERIINLRTRPCIPPVLIKITIIALGTLSLIPAAKGVSSYNNPGLLYALMSMLNAGVPIYSLGLSVEDLRTKEELSDFENKLQKVKLNLVNSLEICRATLSSHSSVKIQNILKAVNSFNAGDSISFDQVIGSLQELIGDSKAVTFYRPSSHPIPYYGLMLGGGVLTFAQLAMAAVLGYKSGELITSNVPACYAIGGVLTSFVFSINRNVIASALHSFYDTTARVLTRTYTCPLHAQLSPKIKHTLTLISLVTVGLSYAPNVQLSIDNFSGNFSMFMQVTTPTGVMVMITYAMDILVKDVVEEAIIRGSDPKAKELIELDRALTRLIPLILKSPMIDFANFLKVLPETLFAQLVSDLEITSAALHEYIGEGPYVVRPGDEKAPLLLNE